jgi:hypothetical protein
MLVPVVSTVITGGKYLHEVGSYVTAAYVGTRIPLILTKIFPGPSLVNPIST